MMNTTRFWVLGLIFACASFAALAVAEAQAASFSIVGVDDMSAPSTNLSGNSFSSKSSFGGGLLIDERLSRHVSFEYGALYISRKAEQTVFGVDQGSFTENLIQVPVQLKFRLLPLLHIGVGGYFAEGVGSISTSGVNGNSTGSESWSAAGLSKTDYGLLGSAGITLPLGRSLGLLVEGRYTYGLANVNQPTSAGTINNRDLQVLAGFTFRMGGGRGQSTIEENEER